MYVLLYSARNHEKLPLNTIRYFLFPKAPKHHYKLINVSLALVPNESLPYVHVPNISFLFLFSRAKSLYDLSLTWRDDPIFRDTIVMFPNTGTSFIL